MDLASTLRVLAKHKILVGLLLLLTIAGTVAAFLNASSSRQAAGSYVLLSAPTPPRLADGTQEATNNPFSDMELSTVVDILVRATSTDQVEAQLVSKGFVGTYKVEGNKDYVPGPVLDLTVVAPTDQEALASYELLATEVQDTLKARQLDAGAKPQYLITTQRLQDPVVTTPGLIGGLRLTIAVLAVGLAFTVGITLAVESFQRSRARKAGEEDEGTSTESGDGSPGDPQTSEPSDAAAADPAVARQPANAGARSSGTKRGTRAPSSRNGG